MSCTFAQYEADALRTAPGSGASDREQIAVFALGLVGEAGEVAETIKKFLGHGKPIDRDKLVKELGDVLWYIPALASMFDITLDEIASTNIEKLRLRYPNGFNYVDSAKRVDVEGGK